MTKDLTDFESRVFRAVAEAGALTMRRVIAELGPLPNWSVLIDSQYLRRVDTVYGSVLGCGPVGREAVRTGHEEGLEALPYLTGASSLADRAYQNDAFQALFREGYTLGHHLYKTASPMITGHRGSDRPWTHQILSTCLRVPDTEAELISLRWGQQVRPPRGVEIHESRLGYPMMYATLSGGNVSRQRVAALYTQARRLSSEWRSPMLVVVPDLTVHRDVLRRVAAEQAADQREARNSFPRGRLGSYPALRLIEQPLPKRVQRTSG